MSGELLRRIAAVKMPGAALREVLAILAEISEHPRDARKERNRRYYNKTRDRLNSDASKTHEASEIKTLPSAQVSPPAPSPSSPPPEQRATRDGQLPGFDSPPAPRPLPPHKRIAWSPGEGWQGILETDRARWGAAYPACDVSRQLSAADDWLRTNPAKAKKSNWSTFLSKWLTRSQDRGGDTASNAKPNGSAPRFAALAPPPDMKSKTGVIT